MPDAKPDRRQQAQIYCRRALDYYEQDKHGSAIKALGMALDLDSNLCDDPRIKRFAVELVGGSPEQAVLTLSNRTDREALASVLTKRPVKKSTILQRRLYYAAVGLMIAIFGGGAAMQQLAGQTNPDQSSATPAFNSIPVTNLTPVINPTPAPTIDPRFSDSNVHIEEHHLANDPTQQYFVSIPYDYLRLTDIQVLIAVHGAGQSGEDMIRQYSEMTTLIGSTILIAPTFDSIRTGTADERFYESARLALLNMVDEVKSVYPINQFGQIYMGYAEGASLVTYSALHDTYDAGQSDFKNEPLAVALFNAHNPLFSPSSHDLPYVLLYSSVESEAHDSLVYKAQLERQGVKLTSRKAGSAHETYNIQFGVLMDFVRDLYFDQYKLNYRRKHV